ncbi:MAG: LytTR family DNA-binding domain-containing protein [Clostridiales bacterium]|nr:LytTR family DNA-binding domain-containing protein [Clostridiales bacterium]
MIKIAIVEDTQTDRDMIREISLAFFLRYQETVQFYEYRDGSEILAHYPTGIDVLLMDIDMPKINGLEAAREIHKIAPDVDLIFITNLIQCALDGYSVSAMDFVVKPVTEASLGQSLSRAYRRFQQRQGKHIEVLCRKNKIVLNTNQILYIETQRHNALIHTTIDGTILASESISALESRLQGQHFYRCHTSFLVNLNEVDRIGLTDLVVDGILIPVSRHRRKGLLDKMAAFMGSNG